MQFGSHVATQAQGSDKNFGGLRLTLNEMYQTLAKADDNNERVSQAS